MVKYHCTKCGYKLEKNKAPNKCPYCSSDNTFDREMSAQDLLDQVTGLDEE